MIDKMTIIIPTWNSMPEIRECIASIKKVIPKKEIEEIIVVDRYSKDGTTEFVKKNGCKLLFDDVSLGSARMKGINEANTDWILFIDSDVIQFENNWWEKFKRWVIKLKKVGMVYGKVLPTEKKHRKLIEEKIRRGIEKLPRKLKKGERGMTHNTLILKDLVQNLDISGISAWEDWLITQEVIKKGYNVYEIPVFSYHAGLHHKTDYGFFRDAWHAKWGLRVAGVCRETLKSINYPFIEGLRGTIWFKDLWYLKIGLMRTVSAYAGIMKKNFRRDKK